MKDDSIIVYDLEILRAIPTKEECIPGIEYCGGWTDYKGMGITVLAAYDYLEKRTHVYCQDNLHKFIELADQRQYRVSWNGMNFDDKVLGASGYIFNAGKAITDYGYNQHYDILREVWAASGIPRDKPFTPKLHGGFGMDAVAQASIGRGKTDDGALAPILWQQGEIGRVINYCIADTWITKLLLDQIIYLGELKNPKTGKMMEIESPW